MVSHTMMRLSLRGRLSKRSFVGVHMARDEGLFILDWRQFYRLKNRSVRLDQSKYLPRTLGIKLSLTSAKRIETWLGVQIPTWGRLRKRWKMLLNTGYFTEAYLSGRDIFLSAPTGASKRLTFWAGSIHFRSFIWGGLLCHRVCDCSVDFFNERSGLKPKFPWHWSIVRRRQVFGRTPQQ